MSSLCLWAGSGSTPCMMPWSTPPPPSTTKSAPRWRPSRTWLWCPSYAYWSWPSSSSSSSPSPLSSSVSTWSLHSVMVSSSSSLRLKHESRNNSDAGVLYYIWKKKYRLLLNYMNDLVVRQFLFTFCEYFKNSQVFLPCEALINNCQFRSKNENLQLLLFWE